MHKKTAVVVTEIRSRRRCWCCKKIGIARWNAKGIAQTGAFPVASLLKFFCYTSRLRTANSQTICIYYSIHSWYKQHVYIYTKNKTKQYKKTNKQTTKHFLFTIIKLRNALGGLRRRHHPTLSILVCERHIANVHSKRKESGLITSSSKNKYLSQQTLSSLQGLFPYLTISTSTRLSSS